jgi:hypothetical protein
MDWSGFLSGLLGASIGGSLVTLYLGHRLSIEREKVQDQRRELQKKRDASAAVVDILAEWLRVTYSGASFDGEAKWRLQTTYWRNILLLDKELLDLLAPRLANAPGAVDTNELIVQVRRVLLKLKEPDITAASLNVWK